MRKLNNKTSRYLISFSFILPCLIGFSMFYLIPAVRGLWFSFTDWDLLSKSNFIGLQNYKKLFQDENFWIAMKTTVLYVLWNIPIQTLLAIGIALVMDRVSQSGLLRSIMLLPWILSNVVVALLWYWMLDASIGITNVILTSLGFSKQSFLASTELALPSVAAINIWRHMGYTALLVFAGLQGVPKEIEEAATIDGANSIRKFFSVILPCIRPVIAFVLITTVVGSFQIYDTIAVTTRGGPVTATYVIYLFIYKNGFEAYKMGYSSAAAMVLFVLLMGVSAVQMKLTNGSEAD